MPLSPHLVNKNKLPIPKAARRIKLNELMEARSMAEVLRKLKLLAVGHGQLQGELESPLNQCHSFLGSNLESSEPRVVRLRGRKGLLTAWCPGSS